MAVWWVNQSKNYGREQESGIVFGRANEEPGSSHKNRKMVAQVRKSDLIIHYAKRHIRAVSRALEDANTTPTRNDAHDQVGWHCEVEYHEFEPSKHLKLYKGDTNTRVKEVQPEDGPIHGDYRKDGEPNKAAGKVKQGYLFPFCLEGVRVLRRASDATWPNWPELKLATDAEGDFAQAIQRERTFRREMWDDLLSEGGPSGVSSDVVRAAGMYRGQAGIWADKSRTAELTSDGQGITVSVLHTGSAYADDLDEEGLLYHYPNTNRRGSHDENEVAATKNAARYGVPVFVITYPDPNSTKRDVRRGWVEDWDDHAEIFLIRFAKAPPNQSPSSDHSHPSGQLHMQLGERGRGGQALEG